MVTLGTQIYRVLRQSRTGGPLAAPRPRLFSLCVACQQKLSRQRLGPTNTRRTLSTATAEEQNAAAAAAVEGESSTPLAAGKEEPLTSAASAKKEFSDSKRTHEAESSSSQTATGGESLDSSTASEARSPSSSTAAEAKSPPSTSSAPSKKTAWTGNYYDLFPDALPGGVPPAGAFRIDLNQLRREFLRLQSQTHPDRHRGERKARAEAASALVNEAYKTLQSPLLRAQYLLSLRGLDVAEDETAKVDDPELLMLVLETREDIENAQREEDLEPLRKDNDRRIMDTVGVLEYAFDKDDLHLAKQEAIKLRYWMNIKESLDYWEKGKPVVLVH